MAKHTATGRSKDGRHIRLYAWLTGSPAWRDLSGNAMKLLIHLAAWEDGSNNGELYMSERAAAEGIGVSKKTAGKLFDELEAHGFIRATARGYFQTKGGPATKWRLTWLSWPAASKPPSNEWRQWQPEQNSRGKFFSPTGVKITPLDEAEASAGVKTTPAPEGKPQKCVNGVGVIITPHTVAIGEGSNCDENRGEICPSKSNGPLDISNDPIREQVASYWQASNSRCRQALAKAARITPGELQSFVEGRLALTIHKQMALRSAVRVSA